MSLPSLSQMRKQVQRQNNFSKIIHLASGSQDVEPCALLGRIISSDLSVLTNMLETKSNPWWSLWLLQQEQWCSFNYSGIFKCQSLKIIASVTCVPAVNQIFCPTPGVTESGIQKKKVQFSLVLAPWACQRLLLWFCKQQQKLQQVTFI